MFAVVMGISATSLVASIALGLARSRRQERKTFEALGIPVPSGASATSAQRQWAVREYAAIEARIRARSPHLSQVERRELAVNLIRARGLVPAA